MLRLIRKYSTLLIITALSVYAIWPYLEKNYIIGIGESGFLIDPSYMNLFYEWAEKINYGSPSSFQANILFFGVFWKFLSTFSSHVHPSIIWAFLAFLLPAFSLYFLLDKVFELENKLLYLPSCLLFTFNIFRLSVSYTNTNENILFIILPLIFFLYLDFCKKQNLLSVLYLILAFFATGMLSSNLAMFSIPYVLLVLYFIFYIITNKKIPLSFYLLNIVLLGSALLVNVYWLVPLYKSLQINYLDSGSSLWNAINAGTFVEHLRFMGFWAFKGGYGTEAYFSYYKNYYKTLLLLSGLFVPFVAFLHFLRPQDQKSSKSFSLALFFGVLAILALFLVGGAKGPFGFIYRFLYDHISVFKIFREPYAKFMPLYIFAVAVNLVISLSLFEKIIKSSWLRGIFFIVLNFCVLLNAYPVFTQKAFYLSHWNQGPAGTVVVIPDYWNQAKSYIESLPIDSHIIVFPYNEYVSFNNWPYGVDVVGNIADYIIDRNFVKGWSPDSSKAGKVLNSLYFQNGFESDARKVLGLMNVKYALQQNDLEWRYNKRVRPPSTTNDYLSNSGLLHLKDFGYFDEKYLVSLANKEPDKALWSSFYMELINKPVLSVYEVPDDEFMPHFYTPNKSIYAVGDSSDLLHFVSAANTDARSQYFIVSPRTIENNTKINRQMKLNADQALIVGKKEPRLPYDFSMIEWNKANVWPSPSIKPFGVKYKLVLLKETIEVSQEKDARRRAIKLSWLGAKRIEEIKKYKLKGADREQLVKKFLNLNRESLALLKTNINDKGIVSVKKAWIDTLLNNYIYFEKGVTILEGSNDSGINLDDVYLLRKEFLDFFNSLSTGYVKDDYIYKFSVPESGNYDLLLNLKGQSWEKLSNLSVTQDITLNLKEIIEGKASKLVEIDGFAPGELSKFVKLTNWKPGAKYIVSFDYKVIKSEIIVTGLEDLEDYGVIKKNNSVVDWKTLFAKKFPQSRKVRFKDTLKVSSSCLDGASRYIPASLESNCYSTYEKVLTASENAIGGYLYIQTPLEKSGDSYSQIKNIKVYEYVDPVVMLKKTNPVAASATPAISFSKVNAARYIVDIKNAHGPYFLIFNEKFHENWRVFLVDPSIRSKNKVSDVIERVLIYISSQINRVGNSSYAQGSTGFELQRGLFPHETKPIPSEHYRSNGFVNGWVIDPSDVNLKTEYQLVIEYIPQRTFYKLLLVSLTLVSISSLGIAILVFANSILKMISRLNRDIKR